MLEHSIERGLARVAKVHREVIGDPTLFSARQYVDGEKAALVSCIMHLCLCCRGKRIKKHLARSFVRRWRNAEWLHPRCR